MALLALRLTVGAAAIFEALAVLFAPQSFANVTMTIGAVCTLLAGLVVTIGLLTPFACTLLCVEGILTIFMHPAFSALRLFDSNMATVEFVVMSAALIALGPGAASVDARRFGRREVAIRGTRGSDNP